MQDQTNVLQPSYLGGTARKLADEAPQTPDTFFKDVVTNTIDDTFREPLRRGFIHNYVDDTPLNGRSFSINGRSYLNFATCSYFGLELDPRVKQAIADAASRYGASFIMSRTYASSPQFAEFEELLSDMTETYPIVTPSTTLGHLSFMSVMVQQGDVLILDQQVHNSVQLAASTVAHKAKIVTIKHSDLTELEQLLQRFAADPNVNHIWYAGDGIYSMFGDAAPVAALCRLLDTYPKFYCYLDDAHGMSIAGKHGRGYVLGQQDRLHPKMVVAVSLSKCFGMGCGGAVLVPHAEWQRKIRTCGPTMIFSSPVPPPMLGAGIALAKIHLSGEIDQLQRELASRIRYFQQLAAERGLPVASSDATPVQYVKIGALDDALNVVQSVFEQGFFVNMCAYPAVPRNKCGLRLTLTRHTTLQDIAALIGAIEQGMRQHQLLSDAYSANTEANARGGREVLTGG